MDWNTLQWDELLSFGDFLNLVACSWLSWKRSFGFCFWNTNLSLSFSMFFPNTASNLYYFEGELGLLDQESKKEETGRFLEKAAQLTTEVWISVPELLIFERTRFKRERVTKESEIKVLKEAGYGIYDIKFGDIENRKEPGYWALSPLSELAGGGLASWLGKGEAMWWAEGWDEPSCTWGDQVEGAGGQTWVGCSQDCAWP